MQETPRKGSDTRERILEVAEAAVFEKGFAGTSIEEVIAAVGITKSGFFYHFKDKNELAKALLIRYVEREDALFDDLCARVSSRPIAIRIACSTRRCGSSTPQRCSIGERGSGSGWI